MRVYIITVKISVIGIVFFGYYREFFLSTEIISESAGGYGRNGYPEQSKGIERDSQSLGNSQIHTVQVASDGMRYGIQVYRPFGRGEVTVCVDYRAVDKQVTDGRAICENKVGNIGCNAQPQTVEGTGLKAFTVYSYLISCSYIPDVRINYKKVEQNGECADSRYYGRTLRILGYGIQQKPEYRKGELIYKKLGYR